LGGPCSSGFYRLIFSFDVVEHHHQALEWNVLSGFGGIAAVSMTPPVVAVLYMLRTTGFFDRRDVLW
jgi:hypothetical protein